METEPTNIVADILCYAGKQRREVSNPHITARETIELANHMVAQSAEIERLKGLLMESTEAIQQLIDRAEKVGEVEKYAALVGKPMKAFIYQDHDAHMATHQAFMHDPMIMAAIGQSPMAQQVMGALQALRAEHLAVQFAKALVAELEKKSSGESK